MSPLVRLVGEVSSSTGRTIAVDTSPTIHQSGGAFTSSPWAYNGKVFCLNEEGKTFVIAAGEKFELLRINPLDEMAQATPAIVGDRLLLRTESRLYSIRNKNL